MNDVCVSNDLKKLKLKVSEIQFRTCESIMVLDWRDKRDINVITNFHDASVGLAQEARSIGLPVNQSKNQ